jgi:hydrogenase expression/formation protein HypC
VDSRFKFWYPIALNEVQMCLAIPVQVVEVDSDGRSGHADYLGTKIQANFALLEDVQRGDWVIVHAGFAISRLDAKEAQETLALLREVRSLDPQ